ncbi:MAG TPA: hypothetical protein P5306_04875, partial [Kiritimatiellia bacterium]|nr:hypothetical protein [Kiritimatiellia bacterium]
MENSHPDFPRHGKNPPDFSTLWKKLFHTVENSIPSLNPEPRSLPPPVLMGILNLTPDSFSDGGQF